MDSERKQVGVVEQWIKSIRENKKATKKIVDYFGSEDNDRNDDGDDCYCE